MPTHAKRGKDELIKEGGKCEGRKFDADGTCEDAVKCTADECCKEAEGWISPTMWAIIVVLTIFIFLAICGSVMMLVIAKKRNKERRSILSRARSVSATRGSEVFIPHSFVLETLPTIEDEEDENNEEP